jgi:hypothetical protein
MMRTPAYSAYKRGASEPEEDQKKKKKSSTPFASLPWLLVLLAAVPLGLLCYYVTAVAPTRIPVPASVNVPFPALTQFLEQVCGWCGKNPLQVTLAGLGLLALGALLPISPSMYYPGLAIVSTVALFLSYYSISAPVDRLLKDVHDILPRR